MHFRSMHPGYILRDCGLTEGVTTLLEHFRRNLVPMAVATSSSETGFRMKTGHLSDQFAVFHHVVTGSSDPEVKNGKPAPDIFKVCASRFPGNPLNSDVSLSNPSSSVQWVLCEFHPPCTTIPRVPLLPASLTSGPSQKRHLRDQVYGCTSHFSNSANWPAKIASSLFW